VGGHPAFNVPLPGRDDAWGDYELVFERAWTYDSPGIVDGLWDYSIHTPIVRDADRMPLDRGLLVHDTIELEGVPGSTVTLAGRDSGPVLRVDFDGFDYLGIWSPGCETGTGPLLAIEPWTGTATRTDEDDVFEHKQGTLVAAPGQTIERSFTITLL
jgi:galactose mutarotase-like enzyme